MKLIAGLQVFEEEDFIRETIDSICKLCDHVIVVEGCWKSTQNIIGTNTSRDKTNEYLEECLNRYKNLEVHHYSNSNNQIEHRQFIWSIAKHY